MWMPSPTHVSTTIDRMWPVHPFCSSTASAGFVPAASVTRITPMSTGDVSLTVLSLVMSFIYPPGSTEAPGCVEGLSADVGVGDSDADVVVSAHVVGARRVDVTTGQGRGDDLLPCETGELDRHDGDAVRLVGLDCHSQVSRRCAGHVRLDGQGAVACA